MTTAATIVLFLGSVAWCADRLVRAERAVSAAAALPPLVGSWVLLMAMRTPTAGRALVAFTLADVAVLVLSVLGVMRLLGGFEQPLGDDGDGGAEDGHDPLEPFPPLGPRRRRGDRPPRRFSRSPAAPPPRHPVPLRRGAPRRGDPARRSG